ncbi:TonB-dependent receptor [Dyadobacter tibetensis]|uniref:TonB-dependent receptor n=1 Tax=Dyadobacter tibetensis TaxID=1211851 RepID=UPI00046F3ED4|nr:TonB-dependent receptor [Dyadobacter tibetensis]
MSRVFYLALLQLIANIAIAQRFRVKGEVVDQDGNPLSGVTIIEKGHNEGVLTDHKGVYSLQVNNVNGILTASKVGYESKDKGINAQATHPFQLRLAPKMLPAAQLGTRSLHHQEGDKQLSVISVNAQEISTLLGTADVNQVISYLVPSFNARQQLSSDGTYQLAPASIRGLGSDQLLVLVNGKRRHQSSLMGLLGTIGRGQASTDLNAIPLAAIDRIEVLPEGAVAQYGSDATGGVINLVLKESTGSWAAQAGSGIHLAQYNLEGKAFDGLSYYGNLNYGLKVGSKGILNLTADYSMQQATNRAEGVSKADIVQRQKFGSPEVGRGSLQYNFKMPLRNTMSLYSFGGISSRRWDIFAQSRKPQDDRNIAAVYPEGYNPKVRNLSDDYALVAGISTVFNRWDVDMSTSLGYNQNRYSLKNSLNPSQGPRSQHEFNAGGFQRMESLTSIDINRYFSDRLQGVNIAYGGQYRYETYRIVVGERPSYYNYDFDQATGSQGFPGFGPDDAVNTYRINADGYVDIEANIFSNLRLDAAARYSYYQNLGSALAGKLGLQYRLGPQIAVKVSGSSEYRAPSLSQQYFNSIYSVYRNGVAEDVLVFNSDHPIADALGMKGLNFEKSQQARIGLLYAPDKQLSIGLDAYYIQVKDRIALSSISQDIRIADKVQALHADKIQFLSNALTSTTTSGVEARVRHSAPIANGILSSQIIANFNWMDLGANRTSPLSASQTDSYLGARERLLLMAAAPSSKINIQFRYKQERFQAMLNMIRYGKHELLDWNETTIEFSPKVTMDLSLQYLFDPNISLTLGVENLMNTYPDSILPTLSETGGSWEALQTGVGGAFAFVKLGLIF